MNAALQSQKENKPQAARAWNWSPSSSLPPLIAACGPTLGDCCPVRRANVSVVAAPRRAAGGGMPPYCAADGVPLPGCPCKKKNYSKSCQNQQCDQNRHCYGAVPCLTAFCESV